MICGFLTTSLGVPAFSVTPTVGGFLISPRQEICGKVFHVDCAQATALAIAVEHRASVRDVGPIKFVTKALMTYFNEHEKSGPISREKRTELHMATQTFLQELKNLRDHARNTDPGKWSDSDSNWAILYRSWLAWSDEKAPQGKVLTGAQKELVDIMMRQFREQEMPDAKRKYLTNAKSYGLPLVYENAYVLAKKNPDFREIFDGMLNAQLDIHSGMSYDELVRNTPALASNEVALELNEMLKKIAGKGEAEKNEEIKKSAKKISSQIAKQSNGAPKDSRAIEKALKPVIKSAGKSTIPQRDLQKKLEAELSRLAEQAEFKAAKERLQSFEASLNIFAGILPFITDPETRKAATITYKAANLAYEVSSAISNIGGLSYAALTGNILGAAAQLFQSFFGGGPSELSLVMGQINSLRVEIGQFREDTKYQLTRMEKTLNEMYGAVLNGLDQIALQSYDLQQSVRTLHGQIGNLERNLGKIGVALGRQMSEQGRNLISTLGVDCTQRPLSESGYRTSDDDLVRCASRIVQYATSQTREESATGISFNDWNSQSSDGAGLTKSPSTSVRELNLDGINASFGADPLADLPHFALVSQMHLGLSIWSITDDGNEILPPASGAAWLRAANDFIALLDINKIKSGKLFAPYARNLLSVADEWRAASDQLRTGGWFTAFSHAYRSKLAQLGEQMSAIEKSWKEARKLSDIDPWGNPIESSEFAIAPYERKAFSQQSDMPSLELKVKEIPDSTFSPLVRAYARMTKLTPTFQWRLAGDSHGQGKIYRDVGCEYGDPKTVGMMFDHSGFGNIDFNTVTFRGRQIGKLAAKMEVVIDAYLGGQKVLKCTSIHPVKYIVGKCVRELIKSGQNGKIYPGRDITELSQPNRPILEDLWEKGYRQMDHLNCERVENAAEVRKLIAQTWQKNREELTTTLKNSITLSDNPAIAPAPALLELRGLQEIARLGTLYAFPAMPNSAVDSEILDDHMGKLPSIAKISREFSEAAQTSRTNPWSAVIESAECELNDWRHSMESLGTEKANSGTMPAIEAMRIRLESIANQD